MSTPVPADDAPADGTPAEYDEPARGYRSFWLFVLLLAAGFGADLGFDVHGAVAHLPGWLIAAALLLGVDALAIHAARSTKSIHLDAQQLRVGDDALDRAQITSSTDGVDDELPVLGWPTGMPRGIRGITVQLADGRLVVVPTRHPQRLRAALGHAADPTTPDDGTRIRVATDDDLRLLGEIEQRANALFTVSGYHLPDPDAVPDYTSAQSAAVFVAGSPPVAFAQLIEVDGAAHLHELDVLPGRMRRGIGSRLLERAMQWASEQGYPAMTLTTFADVAWNGPFYAGHGFVEIPAETPGLQELRRAEQQRGLDDVGRRVVMRKPL